MGKKKLKSLSDLGAYVYATDTNKTISSNTNDNHEISTQSNQLLEAHFSNKGRGGKTAIIITGFKGTESELKSLAKYLKKQCGVGGSVRDGEILIQGNFRDKIMQILRKQGHQVKRVGG